MKRLVSIAEWVVAVFGTLIGAILLAEKVCYSFDEITEKYYFNLHHVVLGCLIYGAVFCLLFALLGKIRSDRRFIAANIAITLLFEMVFCLTLIIGSRIYWGADAGAVYDLAVRFGQGDYSAVAAQDSYLALWPYQYGIIFIYEMLMRCTGIINGKLIQLMNLALMTMGTLAGYGVLWRISPRRSSITAYSLLWMTFFPFFFQITLAYGDVPGICLVIVAVYFTLRVFDEGVRRGALHMFTASAAIILACIFKTNVRICLIAMLLVSAVMLLRRFDMKKVLWLLLTLFLAVSSVPIIQRCYEERAGRESGSGVPMVTYIAMSMQEGLGGPGSWNGYHADLYLRNNYDHEATVEQARRDIQKSMERFLNDPGYMLSFYTTKVAYQWTEGSYNGIRVLAATYQTESKSPWVRNIIEGPARKHFVRIANWHQCVLYVAFMISMLLLLRDLRQKKGFCPGKMYLTVMVIGGFLFELIWESASRYVMMYCVMMFPLAAESVSVLWEAGRSKIRKVKRQWKTDSYKS